MLKIVPGYVEICLWLKSPGNVAQGAQKPESQNAKKAYVLGERRGGQKVEYRQGNRTVNFTNSGILYWLWGNRIK